MAGFRRSTWFALGLVMGGLVGGALGLIAASLGHRPESGDT
jgi:hypothetical protein